MMGRTYVILSHQGMGDCLMALPLIRMCYAQLRENDRLLLIVRSAFPAELLQAMGFDHRVQIESPPKNWLGRKLWPFKLLLSLRWIRPAVLIAPIIVDSLINSIWLGLIGASLCVVQKGSWLGKFGRCLTLEPEPGRHKADEFVAYGRLAGFPGCTNTGVEIQLPKELQETVIARYPWWGSHQRWIAFAPGSGPVEAHKRYPAASFQQLAKLLLAHSPDIGVFVLGTAGERELVQSIVDGSCEYQHRCIPVIGASVVDVLVLLNKAHCLVTGCNGASHLGAAARTRIVGLYGPTNPGHTGARTSQLRVLRMGLRCSPCYRIGFITGCGDPVCMQLIRPDTVFEAVLDCLNNAPYPAVPWCETTNATSPAFPEETHIDVIGIGIKQSAQAA